MIPLAGLSAIPWRLIGYVAGMAMLVVMGWRIHVWHEAFKAYPAAVAALEAEQACAAGSKCAERQAALQARQAAISETVVAGYEQELAQLRDRPPAVPVRLCRPAPAGDLRPASPAGPADGAAPSGDVPLEASGDIGQRLFDLADSADAEALKLRYLQQWSAAMATAPK